MFRDCLPRRTFIVLLLSATLLFQHTSAAVAQPAGTLIQRPNQQNASDSSAAALNSSDLMSPRPGDIVCTRPILHLDPRRSCEEAIRQIPDTDHPLRSANSRYFKLPQRISSSDGKCVVYVGPTIGLEIITGKRLRLLATSVVEHCMVARGYEGRIHEEGQSGNFFVSVKQYDPGDIYCADRSPDPAPSDCGAALEDVPFESPRRRFFSEGMPQDPQSDVELPWMFVGEVLPFTCMVIVDTTGDSWCRWSEIWYVAVAIDAMCVRRGYAGWNNHMGLFSFVFLSSSYILPQET
ncbi:MAG: hypothetical protein Q9185_006994 [Variospora sp. 1 TL-2023]